MEHVEAHTMKLLGTVPAGTMKSSAVHFQPGDVLYGRLRPYLNKETEQHRIVAEVDRRLSFIREVKSQVDANLQRAERLRQSVLGSAFKGSLDVAEPQRVGELFPYE